MPKGTTIFPIMLDTKEVAEVRRADGVCVMVGVPWDMIWEHREWADRNHRQSIAELSDRGGLSACEAIAVIEERRWAPLHPAAAHRLLYEAVDRWRRLHAIAA